MISRTSLIARIQAGLIHLCISCVVALGAAALVFLVWYPAPLSTVQGVSRLVLILISVDVIIGPLITTIVFDRSKKSLPFDLGVVATLQLVALLYGLHAIFIARPALLVYNIDRFDVVPALDVDQNSLAAALQKGGTPLSWWGPEIVAARLPKETSARNKILFSAVRGGADLPQLPEWHVPYASESAAVRARLRPLAELRKVNKMSAQGWKEFTHTLPLPESELGYLPLSAKVRDGSVIIRRNDGEIVRIVLLEPYWPQAAPPKPSPPVSTPKN